MLTREDVVTALKNDIVHITFEKKSGEIRFMLATLMDIHVFDPGTEDEQKKTKAKNDEVLAVWDMESMGWRSFRWENLRTFGGESLPNGIK